MEKSGGKMFLNIVKILLSIFLSGLFVIIAFVFPVYYAAAGIVKPNNIARVVQNVDYVEILKESEEFNAAMDELGLETDKVDEIIKSDAAGGFLEGFANIVTETVMGDSAEGFSIEHIKELADDHIDEITVVLEEQLDKPIKTEEVQNILNGMLDDNADKIESTVANFTSENSIASVYVTVQKTLSLPVILIVVLIEITILGLIYLLRAKNYGGFIWISVNSGIVLLLLAVLAVIVNSGLVNTLITGTSSFVSNIVASALGVITGKLLIAIVVLFVIVAASITAFVFLRKRAQSKLAVSEENEIKSAEAE